MFCVFYIYTNNKTISMCNSNKNLVHDYQYNQYRHINLENMGNNIHFFGGSSSNSNRPACEGQGKINNCNCDEAKNALGPNKCSTDSDCAGKRKCSKDISSKSGICSGKSCCKKGFWGQPEPGCGSNTHDWDAFDDNMNNNKWQ